MKITLCASARFFDRLQGMQKALEGRGYEVLLPSMRNYHHLEETALAKIQYGLMKDHFGKIEISDAVYVANFDKGGIAGYIGGSAFLEMGVAFHRGIPIFLLNPIPKESSYREELVALQPVVVGEDWDRLDALLKKGRL